MGGRNMAKDTKERILETALRLFSEKGYAGTNMRSIANELGLVKSSLYKHFQSKEEILGCLIERAEAYYTERFGSPERLPEIRESAEGLIELTARLLDFTVRDEKIVMVRKLLTIEQYRDERISALATKHFLTGIEEMFTAIFREMTAKGIFRAEDPAMLAFAYTAPIAALVQLCDREPAAIPAALEKARAFAARFLEGIRA